MSEAIDNLSLLDFIRFIFLDEMDKVKFGDFFCKVGDSFLTTLLLFFIASWILSICVDLGRKGWK